MENEYANKKFIKGIDSYFESLKRIKPMTKKQENALFFKAKNGDINARNEIIKANLKFVISIAKHYRNSGIPFNELISEGNSGLLKAFEKFDYNKNVKFFSYGVWWIKQYIQFYIKKRYSLSQTEIYQESLSNRDSFSYMIDDDNEDSYNDEEIDDYDESINNEKILEQKNILLYEALDLLSEREKIIISEYYGLYGKPKTLGEIGDLLGITKERIRQIKFIAIRKMREKFILKKALL